jgi:hypothetical protein
MDIHIDWFTTSFSFIWELSNVVAYYLIIFNTFQLILCIEKMRSFRDKYLIQKYHIVKMIHYHMKLNPDDPLHFFNYQSHGVLFGGTIFSALLFWFMDLMFGDRELTLWGCYLGVACLFTVLLIPPSAYLIFKLLIKKSPYEADLKGGKPNGQGELLLESPHIHYIGQFKNGYRHGFGKIELKNGVTYEGEFDYGLRHGFGKEILPNNYTYEGEWKNRAKVGQGIMTWPDGQKFVGKFEEKVFAYEGPYKIIGDNLFDESGNVVARI